MIDYQESVDDIKILGQWLGCCCLNFKWWSQHSDFDLVNRVKKLIFAGDALNMILPLFYKNFMDETLLILNSFNKWFINHIFKEANFVTHNIVKWAILFEFEEMIPISSVRDFCLKS